LNAIRVTSLIDVSIKGSQFPQVLNARIDLIDFVLGSLPIYQINKVQTFQGPHD
jgi:hypothetical protein